MATKEKKYVNNQFTYTNPNAYDHRSDLPTEKYISTIWQPILKDLLKRFIKPQMTVCDLGCGTLEYVQYMDKAAMIYAVDTNEAMMKYGWAKITSLKHKVILLAENALATSIPKNSCAIVWTIGLSEYVPLRELFTEISRITKPDAVLIIQFPNAYSPYNMIIRSILTLLRRPSKQFRTLSNVQNAGKQAGWNLQEFRSVGMVLPVPTFLSSLCKPLWVIFDFVCAPVSNILPIGINVIAVFKKNLKPLA